MKRFLLLLLLFPLMLSAASTQIEVIPLKYQSAENLLPQLKKFIDSPEQISGMGYQLILRATPERLNELKEVIKKLDLIPQQFVIIVRQGARQRMANSGDQKSIQFNSRDGRVTGNAQIRSYNTRNRSNTPTMQQLRLLEGHWGHILVGRSIPVGEQRVDQTPWGTSVQKRIRYQDVMTGFEVMARRSGSEGVTLTIAPQRQSMGSGGVIRKPGSRYFCESLFWASKPKQTAKLNATVYAFGAPTVLRTLRNHLFAALHNSLSDSTPT
ncbi:secretin N-terminal domain-containing protein [Candidatus Reidiella endopervernicosa]|uniref:NolW-like domain-containing protein n=1 Tax=Candidatus Reidiella endopervernicosa TaxID=2738883 RepID=A0A6N0HX28_9GAMM|nr:secretin N-terminal domain-containing protein [Candidatus Reidiella endopervernicosa]QKQ26706.1 hypothetical protein HUE57_10745 [Candidatus Reidiella endopervernicosa]